MDLLLSFLEAVVDLSNAMAFYILFGLLFAGLLHELVPDTLVKDHLGSDNISSVVKATIFGIPLPVCSCGVIPLATSIKKSGASNGATLSFLISTPITGIDSILATFGMFGWAFTLYRLFTSMIIAMIAGILTNIYKQPEPAVQQSPFSAVAPQGFSMTQPVEKTESCCSVDQPKKKKFSLTKALEYGFITLLGDIAKPLFWGLLLGALITILVPDNIAALLKEYSWVSYVLVVAIAIPMYVCATASLPIAAALILSGVSAGAAFVFLTAGPATNTVTIGVVKKM
ncbi:MAG: SO_0444 family Cu/Zn efflux transporter, partial [Thiovulaceae bacterium]|nr:SO_0444 family Cu/Zn efflux transporter [Sulfurimonadaceae bacterium]